MDLWSTFLDHPRRSIYHCAKFSWNRCSSFDKKSQSDVERSREAADFPLVTMGCPTIALKFPIPKPNYLPYSWTHLTYDPKSHPYLNSLFATMHRTNRQTDTQTHRPTNGWRECLMTIGRFCSIESAAA